MTETTTSTLRAGVLDPAHVDSSIRPQDDFFRHVNGKWLAGAEIPADRPNTGVFYELRDRSEESCRDIIERATAGSFQDPDAEKIAIIYRQFMDETEVERLGAAPLRPLLDPVFAATSHRELAAALGQLGQMGLGSYFSADVENDLNDSSRYILYLDQSGLGLPDESYYHDPKYAEIRAAYRRYLESIFVLAEIPPAGAPDAPDAAASESSPADRVFDFETALAGLHWDIVKSREITLQNNPRSWQQVQAENPGFDWQVWADALELDPAASPVINVGQPDYLAAASALWQATDLSTLQCWLARKLIHFASPYLSAPFVAENFDLYAHALAGIEKLRPRWKRGVALVEGLLGESLGRLYVAENFPADHKERMDQLVRYLLAAYQDSITDLEWMGPETKRRALEKLATFNPKIGYPARWRDYSGLHISADQSLLQNITAATTFETRFELNRLGQSVDRDEWFMTPQTVNAYYNPQLNEVVFPAAILQPPFFAADADDAVNFGAIGAVIGHEIGHGFDDQGSHFDAAGELAEWWTDEDRAEFERRTKALINQYEAYSPAALDDQHHVNGALTIGENIGDLGGLTIAWQAYLKALASQGLTLGDAPVIDGMDARERFFTSWAVTWRGKARQEYAIQLLAIDPHSPDEFRCNGVLANFDEFADYYDLRPGDGLWIEPGRRVHIW